MNKLSDVERVPLEGLLGRLDASDEASARNVLLELEQAARARLQVGVQAVGGWFDGIAATLLESRAETASSQRIEVLILLVQWYFKEGQLSRALPLAERATLLARKAGALGSLRRALNLLGVVCHKTMDLSRAIASYAEAVELAERLGDRAGQCHTLGNLAGARFDLGLLAESIALNRYVVALTGDEPPLQPVKSIACHNIAVALELLGDLNGAEQECEAARSIAFDSTTTFWALQTVVSDATYARILIRQGKLGDAKRAMETLSSHVEVLGGRPAQIQLDLTKALWDAANSNAAAAIIAVEQLRERVPQNETVYRDVLHVAHLCNQYSGQDSRSYEERYLLHLAAWQRHMARQQVAALQRSVRMRKEISGGDMSALPVEARNRLVSRTKIRHQRRDLMVQVESLATLAELREDSTGEHSIRVGWLARRLAQKLGYGDKSEQRIEMAARLHDIGKLAVADVALMKRGKLSRAETEIVRRHALEGCTMLIDILASAEDVVGVGRSTEDQTLRLAAEIALHHHEWWDGSGYPRRLSGEAIPEAARIVSLADTFDDLTQARPYHDAVSIERALEQIIELSGRQFDPRLAKEFRDLILAIQREKGPDLELLSGASHKISTPIIKANQIIDRILRSAEAQLPGAQSAAAHLRMPSATQH